MSNKKQFINNLENDFCNAIQVIAGLEKYDQTAETHAILHATLETIRSLWHSAKDKAWSGVCRHCYNKIKSKNKNAIVCDGCERNYKIEKSILTIKEKD